MSDAVTGGRTVVSGARLAAAAGFVASVADPTSGERDVDPVVARGSRGLNAVELHGRMRPGGTAAQQFTAHGYLTAVHGLRHGSLFTGAEPGVTSANFTVAATGELAARVLGRCVQALDVAGTLAIHRRREPGADWADEASFTDGLLLAEYTLTLRDALSVVGRRHGMPSLAGEVCQTYAGTLTGMPTGTRFGVAGQVWRMVGTGLSPVRRAPATGLSVEIDVSWAPL